MPQLPSGRQVGIHCLAPDDIVRKVHRTYPEVSLLALGMKVKEIDSLVALKPYITILFVRASQSTDDKQLDKRSQAIPDGTEPYDSGYTLADFEQFTADWSEEDKQAFTDFQDVLELIAKTGDGYGQNLSAWMNDVCGESDEA
jgi:hypothetical protein